MARFLADCVSLLPGGGKHSLPLFLRIAISGETHVVMEHTGRYYEQIVQYLHDAGIYVSAVNPKFIKDYGDGNSLRYVKTDKANT